MQEEQIAQVFDLIYAGQVVELDCSGVYLQFRLLEKSGKSEEFDAGKLTPVPVVEPLEDEKVLQFPAFLYGRVVAVSENQFAASFARMPEELWARLSVSLSIPLFISDPIGLFRVVSELISRSENFGTLQLVRPVKGTRVKGRRFLRVSVPGTVILLSEDIDGKRLESPLVDIGGGGLRVETTASWLKVGDELELSISAGFLDEKKNRHFTLELAVPSIVVWTQKSRFQEGRWSYQVGFAFTEISIAEQNRLISFILSALEATSERQLKP